MAGNATRRRKHAYSMIELIVSIFVVGLLLVSLALALMYCNQYLRTCETKAEAQEEALNTAVWLSRYLQDANITVMWAQAAPNSASDCISFQSVRDPYSAQVVWSSAGAGAAVEWPQNIIVYRELDPTPDDAGYAAPGTVYRISERSLPNGPPGGPFPLDPPAPEDPLTGKSDTSKPGWSTKVLARNIQELDIELYSPPPGPPPAGPPYYTVAPGPSSANTVNITIKAFAPYYGLNYGVTVSTAIRPQN